MYGDACPTHAAIDCDRDDATTGDMSTSRDMNPWLLGQHRQLGFGQQLGFGHVVQQQKAHDQTGYRPSLGCRRVRCHGKVIRAHTIRMSVAAVSTYTGHGPNRSSSVAVAGFLLMKP